MGPQSEKQIHNIVIKAATAPPSATVQKTVNITAKATTALPSVVLRRSMILEFFEKHWWLLIPYLGITFLAPLLSLLPFDTGWLGVGIGEVVAVITTALGTYALVRVIKETQMH